MVYFILGKFALIKTLEDFGLVFILSDDCWSCGDYDCHNTTISKKDGQEYNIHIATDSERTNFCLTVTNIPDTNNAEQMEFMKEEEVVKYLCDNFDAFKCF